jgi:capsid portal protein
MRIPFITNRLIRRDMHETSLTMIMLSNARLQDDVNALSDQMKELVAMNRRREYLVIAAQGLADKFDDEMLALHISEHLSETELFPLMELLRAAGRHEAADTWERLNNADETPAAESLAA